MAATPRTGRAQDHALARALVLALATGLALMPWPLLAGCDLVEPRRLPPVEVRYDPPPRAAREPICPEGPLDPPDDHLAEARAAPAPDGRLQALLPVVLAYPGSARARLWAAEFAEEAYGPGDAPARWLAEALALHDEGCSLPPGDAQGAALALGRQRLLAGDAKGAAEAFERAARPVEGVDPARLAEARYARAVALCRGDAADACADALLLALDDPGAAALAVRDDDLAAARRDERVRARLDRALSASPRSRP
jgi:hypothetical protein